MGVPSDHGKIGITVKALPMGTLIVSKVLAAGFIPSWNTTNPDKKVEPGDVIISVNGISGSDAMFAEMKKGQDFNVKIMKIDKFEINLLKEEQGKSYGVRFDSVTGHDGSYVLRVNDGDNLVQEYNGQNPDKPILPTDFFVDVNGCTKYKDIIAELTKPGQKAILVKRGFGDFKANKCRF